ncbi:sigma 54-interacting transcriptional regulator [Thiovibrio sp. JS02]
MPTETLRLGESLDPRRRLALLRQRLTQVTQAWTVEDYRAFVQLFVKTLPKLLGAERCTIFIIEMGTERICSIFGTGIEEREIEPPKKGSVVGRVISSGASVIENNLSGQKGFHAQVGEETGFVTRNMVCAPIKSLTGHGVTGAIQVLNKEGAGQGFGPEDLMLLEEVADYLSISIESIILNQEILRISKQVNREVEELDFRLLKENLLVAESQAMQDILALVREISASPVNVLLQGENGTGKELIARLIHEMSSRKNRPFIAVNCASIPQGLVESEFFGYEKGAFTGADQAREGRFEEANGGTLFLDEIADMPLLIQPKFLRALQEGEGARLGSSKLHTYDFRVISATNKDLLTEKEKGNFREDLYFRLFAVEINIPPLRERREDIVPLAVSFLGQINKHFRKKVAGFSNEVLQAFEEYGWPGNVRQLRREVERLVALTADGAVIPLEKCSKELLAAGGRPGRETSRERHGYSLPDAVRNLEVSLIEQALRKTGGNRTRAAELLRLTRQGLLKKLKRYRLPL